MERSLALEELGDGHVVFEPEYAQEICEALGVKFDKRIIKNFRNEAHPMGYHGKEDADGVFGLDLASYVAACLGVKDKAMGFIGRGSQAREYARVVREALGTATAP